MLELDRTALQPADLQTLVLLQSARDKAQDRADSRPGYAGRSYREQVEELDGIIGKLQDGRQVSAEQINRALR